MKKIKRKHIAVASWVFIWFGAVLSVQPSGDARWAGSILWCTGIIMQVFVAIYLIGQSLTNHRTTAHAQSPVAAA